MPHGATESRHYATLAARLESPLPEDLAAFFHVNTDEGAPELARALAARLGRRAGAPLAVLVVRSLLPRTLVDCNRVIEGDLTAGMTPGLPPYVTSPRDRELLRALHRCYTETASAAYAEVCGAGGSAIALHSYAPRSVEVEVDGDVVRELRRAYAAGTYEQWPSRPAADLLTEGSDGAEIGATRLAEAITEELGELGLACGRNTTYRLHPATQGYRHALAFPGRTLGLEIRRDLLASPFLPFEESPISAVAVARLADALARALARPLPA